jgi:hypothetical protein
LLSSLSSHLLATDILPLVMNVGGEVSLDPHPTDSTLPVSPIFICAEDLNGKKSLHDLIPQDLASVDATMDDVQDLDALLAEVDTAAHTNHKHTDNSSNSGTTTINVVATFELPPDVKADHHYHADNDGVNPTDSNIITMEGKQVRKHPTTTTTMEGPLGLPKHDKSRRRLDSWE